MAADEAGTLAALKARRDTIISLAQERGGRLVGSAGDSLLLEFKSVVDAVAAMIAAQRAIADLNAEVPEDRRMLFRMGVNLGDVLIHDDDIFGDGVNIAARLEPLSWPGGICLSDEVRLLLPPDLQAEFEDQGEREVKNIARPLHLWQWTGVRELAPSPTPTAVGAPTAAPTRLLVRSFDSRGARDDQVHFGADLVDNLIAALSRLTVVIPVNDEAEAHDFTISGSVSWAGDRVRVIVHLTDEVEGTRVWSERYDQDAGDVFALQDRVAEDVAANVRIVIKQQEARRLASRDINAMTVPELLAAAAGIFTTGLDRYDEARRLLERAVTLEPGNSMAQAMLAMEGLREIDHLGVLPAPAAAEALERRTREATRLDPRSFYAHMSAGLIQLYLFHRHAAAAQELDQALALNPGFGPAESPAGLIKALQGDPAGLAMIRHAIAIDRQNMQVERYYFELAVGLFAAGDLPGAIAAARQSVARSVNRPRSALLLVAALALNGDEAEARDILSDLCRRVPALAIGSVGIPPFLDPADKARYVDALILAGLPD